MPAPRHPKQPIKLQTREAVAAEPRTFRNDLLIPLAGKIRDLRSEAASMQTELSPFDLLIQTRPARLDLAQHLRSAGETIEDRLDAQYKTRLQAYKLFLHGMVLMPPLMTYGPKDTEARAIRHVLGRGIHHHITDLATQAAKRVGCIKPKDRRPAATREATLLALGTRQANPDGPILPILTQNASQKEHVEYFTFGDAGQVMHTYVHLDSSTSHGTAYNGSSQPGLAIVTRGELGLMAGSHPWNASTSNQTVFALDDELRWQRTPSYSQDREAVCDIQTGLKLVTDDVMNILNNHVVAYDPTA